MKNYGYKQKSEAFYSDWNSHLLWGKKPIELNEKKNLAVINFFFARLQLWKKILFSGNSG